MKDELRVSIGTSDIDCNLHEPTNTDEKTLGRDSIEWEAGKKKGDINTTYRLILRNRDGCKRQESRSDGSETHFGLNISNWSLAPRRAALKSMD